jgi:hypothetical protein
MYLKKYYTKILYFIIIGAVLIMLYNILGLNSNVEGYTQTALTEEQAKALGLTRADIATINGYKLTDPQLDAFFLINNSNITQNIDSLTTSLISQYNTLKTNYDKCNTDYPLCTKTLATTNASIQTCNNQKNALLANVNDCGNIINSYKGALKI